jgi:hypothetical protein
MMCVTASGAETHMHGRSLQKSSAKADIDTGSGPGWVMVAMYALQASTGNTVIRRVRVATPMGKEVVGFKPKAHVTPQYH